MPIDRLLTRPCTIRRRTAGSDDPWASAGPAPDETVTRCALQQRQRGENEAELADSAWIAFFAADTAIDTGDSIEVDGRRLEVDGEPWLVHDERTGQPHHLEVGLRRTAGAADA